MIGGAIFPPISVRGFARAFAVAALLSAPARAELVKLEINSAGADAPKPVLAVVKIDGVAYEVAGVLAEPVKSPRAPKTLLIETQTSDDILPLALRRGVAVLTLDLGKLPDKAKETALRDIAGHMRGAMKTRRILGRGEGKDADAMADAAAGFDGLLLHDAGRLPAPPVRVIETRVIETWGADAYWRAVPRGAPEGAEPPNRRGFYLAGTARAISAENCAAPVNARAIAPALRALFIALDDWTGRGVAPPAARAPAAGDLVAAHDLKWPKIPGLPAAPEGERRAPKIDADGNEILGLRLPDHALPIATFTGFNAKKEKEKDAGKEKDSPACVAGAAIPFPADKAAREKNADPRPSLVERYGSRAYFVATMRIVADKLVKERLLLPEDADAYVAAARSAPF